MNKSFKVRVYPTKEQQVLLEKTFGANRFVYNYFLNLKSKLYEFYKINLSYNNCSKALTELKRQKPWLRHVDSVSLQQTLRDLDSAYKNSMVVLDILNLREKMVKTLIVQVLILK